MKLPRRRRQEKKTDYKARFNLLKSGKARLVVRKTNRYIIAQIVETDIAQDKTLCSVNSKSLLGKGWSKEKSGSLKSIQAGYVTGFLLGKAAKEKKVGEVIFDIGMYRNIHKSRIYSVLKGAVDSGLQVIHDESALPEVFGAEGEENELNKLAKKITEK